MNDTQETVNKEINKSLARPLALAAGILGALQGLAWTVSSILCICCYFGAIQLDSNTGYYRTIYTTFLDPNGNDPSDLILSPKNFSIFMWFYIFLSTVWMIISCSILWAMIRQKWDLTKHLFGSWAITTLVISVIDLVFTILLGIDYNNAQTDDVHGVVMSLAARGYILWIANVIFAIILAKFALEIIKKQNRVPRHPFINGYTPNQQQNPTWFNTDVKKFWASEDNVVQSEPYYTNRGFERSQSFGPLTIPNSPIFDPTSDDNNYMQPNNNYVELPSTNQPMTFAEAIAQKTATIGKNKGKRSPPIKAMSPYIPPADYTPPNSPTALKSVLRSTSHYN